MKFLTTLFLLLFVSGVSFGQVGVNENNPEQALDVNGKIKVGNDSATPTDGTIRYNDIENEFEGFSDGQWESLSNSSAPDEPIPVTMAMYVTQPSSDFEDMDHVDTHGQFVGWQQNSDGQPRGVPVGFKFVIETISAMSMARTTDEQFRVNIAASRISQTPSLGRVNPQIFLSGSAKAGNTVLTGRRAPLLVLNAGEQLVFSNDSDPSATAGVRMVATGFIVRDVDQYFTY